MYGRASISMYGTQELVVQELVVQELVVQGMVVQEGHVLACGRIA